MKKILAIGDIHAGHIAGLTPPDWWFQRNRNKQIADMQKESWGYFQETLNTIGDIDVLIVNGDAIDGKGHKSGGSELITSDLNEQVEIAYQIIKQIPCKKIFMTHGTPYHVSTGSGEDMEEALAKRLGATIEDQLILKIEGVNFNIRHDVNSSSSPYSRSVSVSKQVVWDKLMKLDNNEKPEDCNVYIRSHVHYYGFCGDSNTLAFTLPALQAPYTKFGMRRCVGKTDWGMLALTVDKGTVRTFSPFIYRIQSSESRIIKVD